jgi:hypothetical protein
LELVFRTWNQSFRLSATERGKEEERTLSGKPSVTVRVGGGTEYEIAYGGTIQTMSTTGVKLELTLSRTATAQPHICLEKHGDTEGK